MGDAETYLKTRQVADALGVSVSSIKRWVDAGDLEASRTMGKHRLVTLSSALKFAQKEKYPVESLLATRPSTSGLSVDDRVVEIFVEALRLGRAKEVRDLISSVCEIDQGVVVLADQLIRPSIERIGQAWLVGSWDVYQEHQATLMIISAVIDQIRNRTVLGDDSKPLAIGASPAGDPYVLPGLLGELVLREVGWEVKNLSNNLPLRSLAKATREYRPKIVFLSASQIDDVDGFIRDYAYFYEAASQAGSAIILGGRALDHQIRSTLVYASFGERMAHLAEFARRLLPASEVNLGLAAKPQGPTNTTT